jgi:hypothetical protein
MTNSYRTWENGGIVKITVKWKDGDGRKHEVVKYFNDLTSAALWAEMTHIDTYGDGKFSYGYSVEVQTLPLTHFAWTPAIEAIKSLKELKK